MSVDESVFRQTIAMVQSHDASIGNIKSTLAKTPDPKTLRDIEHVFKELPPTDRIKDSVKNSEATAIAVKCMQAAIAAMEKKQIRLHSYMLAAYIIAGVAIQYWMRLV